MQNLWIQSKPSPPVFLMQPKMCNYITVNPSRWKYNKFSKRPLLIYLICFRQFTVLNIILLCNEPL